MKIFVLIISITIFLVCDCAKLPSTFTRCSRQQTDSQCLPKAVQNAIRQLTKNINEVNLPNLAPLEVPSLTIGAGSSTVNVQQNFKDVKIFGFTKIECFKFGINFAKNVIQMECYLPSIELDANYELNGKVLLLPIVGNGKATVILDKLKVNLTFKLEEYERKSKKHYKVVENTIVLEPGQVKFNFENLFDGNEALGKNINQVLNDNWKEIFADIKPNYEEAFQKIAKSVFNNLLMKVPISDFFID